MLSIVLDADETTLRPCLHVTFYSLALPQAWFSSMSWLHCQLILLEF